MLWTKDMRLKRTQKLLDDLNILKAQLEEKNIELFELAVTDQLTGLYNRIMLDRSLEIELNSSDRFDSVFGIVLIDIDHFKLINDNYGHQTGDRILVCFAELLQNNTRKSDIVGRWGGEEFMIICPDIDEKGIMTLAEKLRIIIKDYKFPEIHKRTASFGVTLYDKHEDNIPKIIKRADDALYKAKENGRNRIEFT